MESTTGAEPQPNNRANKIELFFISLASLYIELLVIRWLLLDFRIFAAVFKTFPLVTCFVALGVGVAMGKDKLFRFSPIAIFIFTVVVLAAGISNIGGLPFPAAALYQWVNWEYLLGHNLIYLIFWHMLSLLLLLAGPFAIMVSLGSRIGVLFNSLKPLTAYCIDIGGAIVGSTLFAVLSFFCVPPAGLLVVPCLIVLWFVRKFMKPAWIASVFLAAALVCATFAQKAPAGSTTYWSPYFRIDVTEVSLPPKTPGGERPVLGALLNVNHMFQQVFVTNHDLNMTDEEIKKNGLQAMQDLFWVRKNYYSMPYLYKKPKDVLVLGAGAGQDVLYAFNAGAESIDAVEIDPLVVKMGEKYNPAYKSPKVHVYCDDARNFLNRCNKKYDLIVFGCLDSVGLVGLGSSVRTDSYIHTEESHEQCLRLLKPDGLFVASFGAPKGGGGEWLRDKIYETLKTSAGYAPIAMTDANAKRNWPAFVYIAGEPVRNGTFKPKSDPESFSVVNMPDTTGARILTDDWPYLYVKSVPIDVPYLMVVIEILIISIFAGRKLLFGKNTASDWQLFFLGAAFILLELQSISRLSLIYGATWLTSSIVINGVLLMILGANFIIIKTGPIKRQEILYAGLIASLLMSFFIPLTQVLEFNSQLPNLGNAIVTVVTLLPMFMAGLIFASAFSNVEVPARSFGFNLLGSVCGALLEYLSIYWGIKSLVLIAGALYIASMIAFLAIGRKTAAETQQT